MPKNYAVKDTETKEKADTPPAKDDRLLQYEQEFNRNLNILEKYHTLRFDRNYRQYTAFTDVKGTKAKISDPVSPELIERVIQKMFERDPKFYSLARGKNMPKEITNIIGRVVEYFWNCPERVQSSGTMRSKFKVAGREFCIIGNLCVETYYNAVSDTPDIRVIPTEDIVFDATKTLKTSNYYYHRQYVSPEYIEAMMEEEKDGEVIKGRFKQAAVQRVLMKYRPEDGGQSSTTLRDDPTPNQVNRSGGSSFTPQVAQILLVTRYEGTKVCRILDWEEIVEEVDDPMGLGEDPLDFAMDIELPKQPYGLSMLDFLNGLTHAKDLTFNQIVDYSAKALNPPLFVDPNRVTNPMDRRTLPNAWKLGGIVFADPQGAQYGKMPDLPQSGFSLLSYIQQRAEGVSGIGAYTGGVPNQENDKTQGTKGGIQALIQQAVSPIRDRQLSIEESIIEPVVNKFLKIAANVMGQDEIKYALITGESPKWVSLTKGLLAGKIGLKELALTEILPPEAIQELANDMMSQGLDPLKDTVFDVDWVIRVETGSMAEEDMEKDLQAFDGTMQAGQAMGIPLDLLKVWKERATRAGIKDPEQYILQQQQSLPGMAPGMPAGDPSIGGGVMAPQAPMMGQQPPVPAPMMPMR